MAKEIVKPFVFEIGEKKYTLEFNRNSAKAAERKGLTLQDVLNMSTPATTLPLLFWAAFKMHHPEVTQEQADKMLNEDFGGLSTEEVQRLISLFVVSYETLLRDESAGERKNVKVSL